MLLSNKQKIFPLWQGRENRLRSNDELKTADSTSAEHIHTGLIDEIAFLSAIWEKT
jgi:hypothetical protein